MTPSYFNFSWRRLLPAAAVLFLLTVATAMTFAWKAHAFGATPFFTSAKLFAQERAILALFGIRHAFAETGGMLAAAAGFGEAPQSPSSQPPARAIPVLTYHRIVTDDESANVTLGNFMDQMEALHGDGWRTVTLGDYQAFMRGEKELPEKSFLITFDDGAQESFYPVDPILRVLGFNAANYIIISGSRREGTTYYLSEDQIHRMLETGRWEIGSHSFDAHRPYPVNPQGDTGIFYSDRLWVPELGRLETEEEFALRVREDLQASKRALEEEYGVVVDTFAFPFGGEMGHAAAQNYPRGESVTVEEASRIYDVGWMQAGRGEFTYNYPDYRSFIGMRIHVDHDWSGERLLQEMRNGLPKNLPYRDDLSENRGWRGAWGDVRSGGHLALRAEDDYTSASAILDGTLLWSDYEVQADVSWGRGHAFVLGGVKGPRTYYACSFGGGTVRIQRSEGSDSARTLAQRASEDVVPGTAWIGIRIGNGSVSCLFDGRTVLSAQVPGADLSGGIGLQVWDEEPGTASLEARSISVTR